MDSGKTDWYLKTTERKLCKKTKSVDKQETFFLAATQCTGIIDNVNQIFILYIAFGVTGI